MSSQGDEPGRHQRGACIADQPCPGREIRALAWRSNRAGGSSLYNSTVRGGGAHLAFHHQLDAYDTDSLIGALGELRRALGGQKATLVWDGLPPIAAGDARLAWTAAVLAGGGAAARLSGKDVRGRDKEWVGGHQLLPQNILLAS